MPTYTPLLLVDIMTLRSKMGGPLVHGNGNCKKVG